MFNIYSFEREVNKEKAKNRMIETSYKWEIKHAEQKEIMASTYRERVSSFLDAMKENPLVFQDHMENDKLRHAKDFRPEDKTKFIGHCMIKTRYHSNTRSNSPLFEEMQKSANRRESNGYSMEHTNQFVPFRPYSFRVRSKQKELFGDMKFNDQFSSTKRSNSTQISINSGSLKGDMIVCTHCNNSPSPRFRSSISVLSRTGRIRVRNCAHSNNIEQEQVQSQEQSEQQEEKKQNQLHPHFVIQANSEHNNSNYQQQIQQTQTNASFDKSHMNHQNKYSTDLDKPSSSFHFANSNSIMNTPPSSSNKNRNGIEFNNSLQRRSMEIQKKQTPNKSSALPCIHFRKTHFKGITELALEEPFMLQRKQTALLNLEKDMINNDSSANSSLKKTLTQGEGMKMILTTNESSPIAVMNSCQIFRTRTTNTPSNATSKRTTNISSYYSP